MSQRRFKLSAFAAFVALALASCITDVNTTVVFGDGEGEPVIVSLNPNINGEVPATRAGYHGDPDDPELDPGTADPDNPGGILAEGHNPKDVKISEIRIILFQSSTGNFVTEDVKTVPSVGATVAFDLLTGTYDAVIIANESSDPSDSDDGFLTEFLSDTDNYQTISHIKSALIDGRAFDKDLPIPMFAVERGVHFSREGIVTVGGTEYDTRNEDPWTPVLMRAGVRLSFEITLTTFEFKEWKDAADEAGKSPAITISKIPTTSWLQDSGKTNGGSGKEISVTYPAAQTTLSAGKPVPLTTGYYWFSEGPDPDPLVETDDRWVIRYDRIILPEFIFEGAKTDASKAMLLEMTLGNRSVDGEISSPDPDISTDGFRLPRNLWLHLDVSVASAKLRVIPQVLNWNATGGGGTIVDRAWLRVDGPVYIANVWPQSFDAVTSLDNVALLREGGNPKIEYIDGSGWLTVTEAATTIAGTEGGEATETRTVTVRANADNTGKYRRARVWVVATSETTGEKFEKWVEVIHTSGIPASPGVIGYVAEGPDYGRLTLRGSREYAAAVYDGQRVFHDAALDMFPDEGGLESVTVYAAYFKWGSLVAVTSELTDNLFDAGDIAAVPRDYKNIGYPVPALEALRATIPYSPGGGSSWDKIPYRTDSDALSNGWKSEPVKALGDPCAYYFKDWRMPISGATNRPETPADGWNNGTFGTTYVDGSLANGTAIGEYIAAAQGHPGGRRAGTGTNADWSMFMPFTGGRFMSGVVRNSGTNGHFWSSTPNTTVQGFYLSVNQGGTRPSQVQDYDQGMAVRCIDSDPPLPRGVHAAPGTIGYLAAGPRRGELTLRGSAAFAGTAVDNAGNTAAFGPLEDNTVYVSLFKFGSLVATSSQLSDQFDSGDVIAAPEEYDLQALKTAIDNSTGNNKWSRVPYNTAPVGVANGWPQNLANGLGDPCTVYFGADWHLPTAGAGDPHGWYKEGGAPFLTSTGSSVVWADFTATGGKWINPSNSLYSDFPEQGIVAGNGDGTQDWHMFLSAGGLRLNDSGASDKQRTNLQYWTSTTTDASNGYYLTAGDESMNPRYNWHRSFGMAVRCVTEP